MRKLLDPRQSKFLGIAFVAAGVACLLFWPSVGLAYFAIIYGGLCLIIPHKMMPSEDEIAARNSAFREKIVTSRDAQIDWYLSPVFIGLIVFSIGGLLYAFFF